MLTSNSVETFNRKLKEEFAESYIRINTRFIVLYTYSRPARTHSAGTQSDYCIKLYCMNEPRKKKRLYTSLYSRYAYIDLGRESISNKWLCRISRKLLFPYSPRLYKLLICPLRGLYVYILHIAVSVADIMRYRLKYFFDELRAPSEPSEKGEAEGFSFKRLNFHADSRSYESRRGSSATWWQRERKIKKARI